MSQMIQIRPRGRRSAALATAALLLVVAAAVYAAGRIQVGRDPGRRGPPPQSFDKRGFALWPEDTAAGGRAACRERADEEPWRLSAADTIRRFAIDVFGWKHVDIGDDVDGNTDRVRIMVYGAPLSIDLGHTIAAFRYDRCWFIDEVLPRDGGPHADQILHPTASGTTLLEVRFPYNVSERVSIEAGFGERVDRGSNLCAWRRPPAKPVTIYSPMPTPTV